MFSPEECLRARQSNFARWNLMVRCDRCERKVTLRMPAVNKANDGMVAAYIRRVKCKKCRRSPDAAMLTNARDTSRIHFWANYEGPRGIIQILLWAPRNS